MTDAPARRIPTWLIALAGGLAGLVLGAGVLAAGAQDDATEEAPAPENRRAALAAFVACAEDAGVDLPEVRGRWRDRDPLTAAEREAVASARDACGHLLPRAEEREAVRQCLVDAGVLEDGERPDRGSWTDAERSAFRDALRTCLNEAGVEIPRRCRPWRDDA